MSFLGIIAAVSPIPENMNKKRKILTVLALALFGVIIGMHHIATDEQYPQFRQPSRVDRYVVGSGRPYHVETRTLMNDNMINDVRVPVFALAVFYVGLFFILGPTAGREPPAQNIRNLPS